MTLDLSGHLEQFPEGAVLSGSDPSADPRAEMGGALGGPHRLTAILAHKGSNATSGHYGAREHNSLPHKSLLTLPASFRTRLG